MNSYKSKVLCAAPFSSLVIHQTGKMHPCCVWNNDGEMKLNTFSDESKTIVENFQASNSLVQKNFRAWGLNFENYSNCKNCIKVLDQNNLYNTQAGEEVDRVKYPYPTSLHFKISNLCNLACRTCDPENSSLIAKEKNFVIEQVNKKKKYEVSSFEIGTPLYQSLLNNFHNLKHLWFSGGEPLINPTVWGLLEYGYNSGFSKNISLQFNTNGTVKLKESHLEILKSYKNIHMHISMDSIGQHAEYIRTNVEWNEWIKNLEIYYDNFASSSEDETGINVTVSVFNVHMLEEIDKFFREFKNKELKLIYNWVFYPKELCISNLNNTAKDFLRKKYQDSKNFTKWKKIISMLDTPAIIDPKEVVNYIDSLDENAVNGNFYKNYLKFKDVDPEWYKIISS